MRNMIRNAVMPISKRDLVTCNRCGCHDLAWVKFKSGKSALVQTAVQRPLWSGDGPPPVGLYALKFNYHRCDEYQAQQAAAQETVRLAELAKTLPHPKALTPHKIISDAVCYLFTSYPKDFQIVTSPIFEAAEILARGLTA